MYASDNPQDMTPDERLQTIAAVLPRVFKGRTARTVFSRFAGRKTWNSFADRLELSGKTRLSVTSGQRHEP